MTQIDEILSYLKTGRKLTQIQALRKFGTTRLAVHINKLRKRGFNIITETVKTKKGSYGRYSL